MSKHAKLFDKNLFRIGQIVKMSDPNLEKHLLKKYFGLNEITGEEYEYTSDEIINTITEILHFNLKKNVTEMFVYHNLPIENQKETLKKIITTCYTYLRQKPAVKILVVQITYRNNLEKLPFLSNYFVADKEKDLELKPNGNLNFGIFNYFFAKEFLNFNDLPKFTMKQWIYLMNRYNPNIPEERIIANVFRKVTTRINFSYLFFDEEKEVDLINRVRLIFKEMYMRKQTEIILLDGHGRTIFLLIQFMHVYNYKFNIKVYEISEPTHLWHEDFFPTSPDPENNVLVNIQGSIEQLISTPELCQANLPNRLVYLNFCGIDQLYQLILNFIKKYKDYVPQNFSLWISSIVTRTDASYLYNISVNPGSISNFFKIGILLYISFISSGNTIGESDRIPVKLINDKLYDTSLSLDFRKGNQREIDVTKGQLKSALLEHIENKDDHDANGNSILGKLFDRIGNRQRFDNDDRKLHDNNLDRVIKSVMAKNFYENLQSITPEQKCVVRRGGENSNQPNKGQSFVTFRIDINRLREFEIINAPLVLNPAITWEDFYRLFRNRYGFVPKYFLKYLKYKQKYLNLVEKIKNNNNNILNYNYINEIEL